VAFYSQVADDRFESTEHTRGPWDAFSQHAGPPAALLGRAIEKVARPDLRLARLTFDISRPVPIAPLTVTTRTVREGRSVALIEAAIEPYMRCSALLIRQSPQPLPEVAGPGPRLEDARPQPFFPVPWKVGYHTSMEVRFGAGSFLEPGPATCWMRMRVPLVRGEEPSPLARVLAAADSGNGVSNVLDFSRHLFVNADLTVHLIRYPAGDWVCLEAATFVDPAGIGLADTALYDEHGRIGRGAQSLFVAAREAATENGPENRG
jgi:Acyl-CoA thioesterase C-terminal domain/Acyl-CoA thioesterase N-terminal domain